MSDEKNTELGELLDTELGEQVSELDEQNSTGDDDSSEAERKAVERQKAKEGMLKKIPTWLKEEIQKEALSTSERQYTERRDKERFDELLPKVVKDNDLSQEQQQAITEEVERLRKFKDDEGNRMTYEEALRLATRDLNTNTIRKAMKINAGALPPQGDHVQQSFQVISADKFQKLPADKRKEYMKKSVQTLGEVTFS